jgi:hypothetical protein
VPVGIKNGLGTTTVMAQVLVMVENSLAEAFGAIDALVAAGSIPRVGGPVLKALYVLGWQDGFVSSGPARLPATLGLTEPELALALRALEQAGAIALRPLGGSGLAVELLALSGVLGNGTCAKPLSWWRYYFIMNVEDGNDAA